MRLNIILSVLLTCLSFVSFGQSRAIMYTNHGNITLYLEDTLSPITAGNFIGLVNQKYYDGVIFHRVIDNFMIQGGDATKTGGSKAPTIQDEFITGLSNVQGTISMANAGPNTGTSQFFINLVDNTYLDFDKTPTTSKHPVFGHVVDGFSVVQAIGKVPVNNNVPVTAVVMDSVRIAAPGPVSSIITLADQNKLQIYPNPANNELFIQGFSDRTITIELLDLNGRLVKEVKPQSENYSLDVSSLENGVFILRTYGNDFYNTTRIVIQH
ncbi:MAG: peptidylprolyl isomerase [Salibacteraceae bacterium]